MFISIGLIFPASHIQMIIGLYVKSKRVYLLIFRKFVRIHGRTQNFWGDKRFIFFSIRSFIDIFDPSETGDFSQTIPLKIDFFLIFPLNM